MFGDGCQLFGSDLLSQINQFQYVEQIKTAPVVGAVFSYKAVILQNLPAMHGISRVSNTRLIQVLFMCPNNGLMFTDSIHKFTHRLSCLGNI